VRRRNMKNTELPQSYLLTDEVDVDFDVLRAAVMDWVGCHVHIAHIVNRNQALIDPDIYIS
jgi:hypothetical protein